MDDSAAGRQQAHLVRQALEAAGIEVGRLWMHYFSIGGDAGTDFFNSPSDPYFYCTYLLIHYRD